MAEHARELDLKEADEELQLISSRKSIMHLNSSLLIPNTEDVKESAEVIKAPDSRLTRV